MNVLITDYHCASNRGDAAILEGVYASLSKIYPNSNISVMTEYPRAARLIHGLDVEEQVLSDFQWNISRKNAARAYLSATGPLCKRGLTPPGWDYINKRGNVEPYLNADLVVSTGGQFLTDIYFPGKVGVLWEQYFLSQINTPVVIYAQTLGPFDRFPYRSMTKDVLDRAELIITRDEQSKRVVDEMDVSAPLYSTADAAFSMNLDTERERPLNTLNARDSLPPEDEPTVSISVREWKYTGEEMAEEKYKQAISDVADWLISEKDVNVIFASTCTSLDGYHKDDRLIATEIVDLMQYGHDSRVQILTGEYTPQQLVEIYERMDLHIGMRMHSNILAMIAEIPVIAIQYQIKTEGLMEMFGISEYIIDIDRVDTDRLRDLVEKGFDNRDSIAETVRKELPNIKEESYRSAELIKENVDIASLDGVGNRVRKS